MDGSFDRLYAAFFEKGIRSSDEKFRKTAFQYFDSYLHDVNAPAAHDNYFICFTPMWSAFMTSGRLDLAEGRGSWLSSRSRNGKVLIQANS
jgi:hypothetical protein